LHQKIPSDRSRNENGLGYLAKRCGGASSNSGEVVAVGSGHPLDHADVAEAAKLARELGRRELIKQRQQIGAADPGDIDPRILQSVQQRVVGRIEEVDTPDGLVVDLARLGEAVERTNASREVVERRQMLQIAAVAAEQATTTGLPAFCPATTGLL
jgi:hypothetical protein